MDPIINLDEPIGKIVGRRRAPNPLAVRPGQIAAAEEWRRAFGGIRVPKGVFRFHSHAEANEWMMSHLTRPRS